VAKSRYAGTPIVDRHHYELYDLGALSAGYRQRDFLAGVRTFDYVIQVGDRADHLAARFLNDDSLWWLVCLCNGIYYPFSSGGFSPGITLRIPLDPQDVLARILR
jgi:hypothetical protein